MFILGWDFNSSEAAAKAKSEHPQVAVFGEAVDLLQAEGKNEVGTTFAKTTGFISGEIYFMGIASRWAKPMPLRHGLRFRASSAYAAMRAIGNFLTAHPT